MKTDTGPKADGLNSNETKREILGPARGVRPVRKRGYYRALKRGESWAKLKQISDAMIKNMTAMFLCIIDEDFNAPFKDRILGLKDLGKHQ